MKSTRIINAILASSLIVFLVAIPSQKWADFFSPAIARAQDSKSNRPPLTPPNPDSGKQEDQDKPRGKTSISVSVDLVSLQILVTDKKGNVVTGLKSQNFTIYEDNVKQEISNFAPIDANMTVVLLLDASKNIRDFLQLDRRNYGMRIDLLPDLLTALNIFTSTLRKDDWVAVVGYDLRPTILVDFTQDRSKFQEVARVLSYPLSYESNLYDAVIDTLNRTQELEGKVAIVLLGTGMDTFSKHTYDDALKKCKEANASIYAIGLGQMERTVLEPSLSASASMDFFVWETQLRSFAEFTGGAAYFPRFSSEYNSIFGTVSKLLRSQYSIAYNSSNTVKDGKFRKIKVDVQTDLTENGKPLKLNVVTRKGYIAAQQ
jgi:Ca-activated chloride channel homolog